MSGNKQGFGQGRIPADEPAKELKMHHSPPEAQSMRIPPLANALGGLFVISYLLCIGFGLLAPDNMRMWTAWAPLLPGFEWLTWPGFLLGAIESYAYGWYIVIVFVPLYRWFARADRPANQPAGQSEIDPDRSK